MKRIVSLLVVLIMVLGCGLSDSSPTKAVQSFFSYVDKGEVSKAEEMLSQGAKQMMAVMGGPQAFLTEGVNETKGNGGIKSIKIVKEEITGETANVNYEITYGKGKIEKDNAKLIKEEGKWKINISK